MLNTQFLDEICATPGCERLRQYSRGFTWDRCCKSGFIHDCSKHDRECDANEHRRPHPIKAMNTVGRRGFIGGVPCPFWLLDVKISNCVVVPLALGRQTNPIYSELPGNAGSVKLVRDYHHAFVADEFCVSAFDGQIFIAVRLSLPRLFPGFDHGWMNFWNGPLYKHHGTLYCTFRTGPSLPNACLCICIYI